LYLALTETLQTLRSRHAFDWEEQKYETEPLKSPFESKTYMPHSDMFSMRLDLGRTLDVLTSIPTAQFVAVLHDTEELLGLASTESNRMPVPLAETMFSSIEMFVLGRVGPSTSMADILERMLFPFISMGTGEE